MKTFSITVIVSFLGSLGLLAQSTVKQTSNVPEPTTHRIVERGVNHRVWQWETFERSPAGRVVAREHKVVELVTGMHYKDANGQWQESQELIESYPGGAIARQGQYQVIFANNLNSYGAIDMQTSDKLRLRSNILGLMYLDTESGNAVFIARIQDSAGVLESENQVVYPDAFEGVKADVRYTYKRGGFEQDVILREQPPTPESYGLNPDTTVLEVVTEFLNPPTATIREDSGKMDDQRDETISWGKTEVGHGRAFDLNTQDSMHSRVPVNKRYLNMDGRTYLIERVQVKNIKNQLDGLPLQSSIKKGLPVIASKTPVFPNTPVARIDTSSKMKLAWSPPSGKGYVLDYITMNDGQTNFTFKGDTTYYISGAVNLYGTTVIEGGAVLKYATGTDPCLWLGGPLECQTGPYSPAVFTAKDDDTVGETISGSTGNPSGYYGWNMQLNGSSPMKLHDLRVKFAEDFLGMAVAGTNNILKNVQFHHIKYVINAYDAADWKMQNLLLVDVGNVMISASLATIHGENWTVDGANAIHYGITLTLTNSVLSSIAYVAPFTSANNVFDSIGYMELLTSVNDVTNNSGNLFQTVGGGSHYLADNSPYRNIGATNISPELLLDLSAKTTLPPIVQSNQTISASTTLSYQVERDTNAPDLGYHYAALDYVFGGCDLFTNLSVLPGTAVGCFLSCGNVYSGDQPYSMSLNDGAGLFFNGTATLPCQMASADAVQEGGNGIWTNTGWMAPVMINGSGNLPLPQLTGNFLKWHSLANSSVFRDNWNSGVGRFSNCEFYNGSMASYAPSLFFTNCLLSRVFTAYWNQIADASFTYQNCTFREGMLTFSRGSWNEASTNTVWRIINTAFDGTCFASYDALNGDTNCTQFNFNSYNTNNLNWQTYPFPYPPQYGTLPSIGQNDLSVPNYNWQTGYFGDFYLPTNSLLINAGSATADLLALYHFTTQTDQTKETNSTVDIGCHYVAIDPGTGQPFSTYGSGVFDYLWDSDGNFLSDEWEVDHFGHIGVDPNTDSDGDGMTNLEEFEHGFNPTNSDENQNSVLDGNDDWDGDLLSNVSEIRKYGTDPHEANSQSSIVNDGEYKVAAKEVPQGQQSPTELQFSYAVGGGNYTVTMSGGIPGKKYEFLLLYLPYSGPWTHWRVWFSEVAPANGIITRTIPAEPPPGYVGQLDVGGVGEDSDGDGLSDIYELYVTHTLPDVRDSSIPGIADGDLDPDGDGIPNVTEYHLKTDPNHADADADGDGLPDAYESLVSNTDPNKLDTDGDTISDADEVLNGSDPLTPNSVIPASFVPEICPQ